MSEFSVGIDIGGTFTDIVVYDKTNNTQFNRKVLTTYDDPTRAVLDGIGALITDGKLISVDTDRIVHATTLFTNALIERRGAVTGLLTTEGFRDALEIGRERKFELYDVAIRKPEPLIPRVRRREVRERIDATGAILKDLDKSSLEAEVTALVETGVTSLAIVFLHSYLNGEHEHLAGEFVRTKFPELSVSLSSDVAPEVREFERASTTAANAYVKPLATSYLERLAEKSADVGISAPLHLMISSGGLTHVEEAKRSPVQMLESGPAAGALAGAFFGAEDAGGNLLAFDMGGTTAKLCLVDGGEPSIAYHFEAGRQKRFVEGSGLPIRISTIELLEIGAGGGSVADVDGIGFLKVGPQSAGSEPGPAAYGRGGTNATVTDADFALGYLNPEKFAGGMLEVDMAASAAALDRVAEKAELSRTEIAWGIHNVVNENMANAARVHIAERGRDPRDFALLCTGGAGPVHAYYVAKKLGLKKLICPPSAGVASALGLLVAPGRADRVATVGALLDNCDLVELEKTFKGLEAEAGDIVRETGLDPSTARYDRLADGRFKGQGFEIVVPLSDGPYDSEDDVSVKAELRAAFEAGYREKFSNVPPSVPIEFINIRVSVRADVPGGNVLLQGQKGKGGNAFGRTRKAYFPEQNGYVDANVYDRSTLVVGEDIAAPAIIEEEGSTLIVGPGAKIEVSSSGNLIVHMPDAGGVA